jgi:iron(III) transport system permease protein
MSLEAAAESGVRGNGIRLPNLFVPGVIAALLIYLALTPILLLVVRSFQAGTGPLGVGFTLDHFAAAYTSQFTYSTFLNSLGFAFGSALVSFVIGTGLALVVQRTNLPFRNVVIALIVVPLILPGVLDAIAWIFLLGSSGYINVVLKGLFGLEAAPLNIFTLAGMIWVQAIGQVPLVFLLMMGAFRSMDPSLEESGSMSGAGPVRVFLRITMRLLLPTSASVLLLMFVRALEGFEVPALIGIPAKSYVYTSEIFLAFQKFPPDFGRATALAVGLLVISGIGIALYVRSTRSTSQYQTVTGKAFRSKRWELGRYKWVVLTIVGFYAFTVAVLPFLIVLWASFMPYFAAISVESLKLLTLDNYAYLAGYSLFRTALFNSVVVAILAATATTFLAAVTAWIVYRARVRGAAILDFLAFLPIAVPGIVLGIGIIMVYVRVPLPVYGTLWVILIAYLTKYMPYAMRSASGAVIQIHSELEAAASMSGAGWWQTFRRITLPLMLPGLAAAWIYICIVSFREFSTSILLVNPDSTVLSVLLFQMFEQGSGTEVAAVGVVMVGLLLLIIGVFYRVTGRFGLQP